MAEQTRVWSTDAVAARFHDAVVTGRRLPPVREQGYFNVWPAFVRTEYERMAGEDPPPVRVPATPQDVEEMLEAMRWIQWLELERRRLVWMRADNYDWNEIGRRFGCCRTTAWRHWQLAIGLVAVRLNESASLRSKRLSQVG